MHPERRSGAGTSNAGPAAPTSRTLGQMLRAAVDLHRQGRREEAETLYRRILKHQPKQPDALHLLGQLEHGRGHFNEALDLFSRAIAARPNAIFWISRGAVLLDLQRWDEAAGALRRAISLDPQRADAHNALGYALLTTGAREAAIAAFERALALRPAYPEALNNLGSALRAAARLEEAESALQRSVTLRPGYGAALANLGLVLQERGRYADALDIYDRAVAAAPGLAAAHGNRAMLLLLLGRLEEGFAEYQWRWKMPGFATPVRELGAPAWDGSSLTARTLLVHAEQGLGSAIQFVRYVSRTLSRTVSRSGAARVILECPRPLLRLFRQSFSEGSGIDLVAKGDTLPRADWQVPLMSLPQVMGTSLASIPADVPYLRADPDEAATWRQRLAASPRPRVGLVWAGNPRHENDHNRSMPARFLAPLIADGQATMFSLQVPASATDLAVLPGVTDLAKELTDFAATAAGIEALDLVISVDTAAAHLAGALGKPVWLLLPYVPEWRWLLEREDSPWYPTMRLFRQSSPGDWAGVVERVAAALAGWSPEHGSSSEAR